MKPPVCCCCLLAGEGQRSTAQLVHQSASLGKSRSGYRDVWKIRGRQYLDRGVSIQMGDTRKLYIHICIVYREKSDEDEWFGGTLSLGNLHMLWSVESGNSFYNTWNVGSKKGTTSITDMAKQNIDIWRMQKSLAKTETKFGGSNLRWQWKQHCQTMIAAI